MLEKQNGESQHQLQIVHQELQATQQENQSLRAQVEELHMFNQYGTAKELQSSNEQSLFNELEMCEELGQNVRLFKTFINVLFFKTKSL